MIKMGKTLTFTDHFPHLHHNQQASHPKVGPPFPLSGPLIPSRVTPYSPVELRDAHKQSAKQREWKLSSSLTEDDRCLIS